MSAVDLQRQSVTRCSIYRANSLPSPMRRPRRGRASQASGRLQHQRAWRPRCRSPSPPAERDRLAVGDLLAERLARCAYSTARSSARCASPTHVIATEIRLGREKAGQRDPEAVALLAESVRDRDGRAVEDEVAVVGAAHPIVSGITLAVDPLAVRRHHQRDRSVGTAGALQPREQQQVVGDRPERDQVLLARSGSSCRPRG